MNFNDQMDCFFRQWAWLHREQAGSAADLLNPRRAAKAARHILELDARAKQLQREYRRFLERHEITE